MRSAQTVTVVGAGIALAALLAGCGAPAASPGDGPDAPADDTPASIQWETEGTSDLESDPYVIAARAEDTGYLLAVNAQDFSLPEFTSTHTAADAQEFYDFFVEEFVDGGAAPILFPGPSIWLPLEVTENAAGDGADVLLCDASLDWTLSAEYPEPSYDLTAGETLVITIVTDPDTGELVFGGEDRQGEPCDATGAPVGRFVPQPVVPESISLEDVTAP